MDLNNAALEGADLSEISWSDACLRGVDLRRADLRGSNLCEIDLRRADVRGADLSGTNLSGADLRGAKLLPYDKRDPAKLSEHNLNGAVPGNFDLSSNDLIPSNLRNAILKNTELSGALLVDAEDLTQNEVDQAIGDQTTRLPAHLRHPVAWSNSTDGKPVRGTNDAIKEAGKELVRTASRLAASVLMWRLLDRSLQ